MTPGVRLRCPDTPWSGGQSLAMGGATLKAALVEVGPTSPYLSPLRRDGEAASRTQLPFSLFPLKLLSCVSCHLNLDGLSPFRPLCGETFFKSSSETGPSLEERGGWGTGVAHSLLNREMSL